MDERVGRFARLLTPALSRKRERGNGASSHTDRVFRSAPSSAAGTAAPCSSRALSAAASWRKKKPRSGARRDARAFDESTGCAPGEPRSLLAESRGHGCPRDRGCLFSWLLLVGQAKRSNSAARMADETHRDVSRFSRSQSSQCKAGSRPEQPDEPATPMSSPRRTPKLMSPHRQGTGDVRDAHGARVQGRTNPPTSFRRHAVRSATVARYASMT
jgi:hypothetical protein